MHGSSICLGGALGFISYADLATTFGDHLFTETACACMIGPPALLQGTLTHMAPELLLHGHASKASDVYAFAILLWELYTARKAFQGKWFLSVYVFLSSCAVSIQAECRVEWGDSTA